MTHTWNRDVFFAPGDAIYDLRQMAVRHRLTNKQRRYLRNKLLKDKIRFRLFGPLY